MNPAQPVTRALATRLASGLPSPWAEAQRQGPEESDEHHVAQQYGPSDRLERDHVEITRRKPRLRQHERGGEQRRRRDSSPARDERHERDQPDEVLRREHLSKGD